MQIDLKEQNNKCLADDVKIKALIENLKTNLPKSQVDLSMRVSEITMSIQILQQNVSDFKNAVQIIRSSGDRDEYVEKVKYHLFEIQRNYAHIRSTALYCSKQIASANRDQLFDTTNSVIRNRQAHSLREESEQSMQMLSDLLSRMDSHVRSSESTLQALVESSGGIQQTEKEYYKMGSYIQQSSKLLAKLNRRELTDKILISLALIMFLLTCAYIVKKRIFGHIAYLLW